VGGEGRRCIRRYDKSLPTCIPIPANCRTRRRDQTAPLVNGLQNHPFRGERVEVAAE
jgi:hypothetical protein